ncbi:MAG: holo-ACP synthase [Alphaproteobacteria bacterium]|nr:holo-ACP synthase [Alphaproteobacteria bacterium]
MILGIGTDIVEIKHFRVVLKKNPAVLKRVFTKKERTIGEKLSVLKKNAYYAKRFAAKEAVAKACGTGIGNIISWQDIEISNLASGMPVATLSENATALLKKKLKVKKLHLFLSLSDEKGYATAFAVLEEN